MKYALLHCTFLNRENQRMNRVLIATDDDPDFPDEFWAGWAGQFFRQLELLSLHKCNSTAEALKLAAKLTPGTSHILLRTK